MEALAIDNKPHNAERRRAVPMQGGHHAASGPGRAALYNRSVNYAAAFIFNRLLINTYGYSNDLHN